MIAGQPEPLLVVVQFREGTFELSFGPDSRLSQLVAQFHLHCRNIEGCRVTLKYRGKVINNLSQRIADVAKTDSRPTIQLIVTDRQIKCASSNCQFYENELRPPGLDLTIEELLQFKHNYSFLEGCNQYVQWMFPTSFKSTFNDLSHLLTEEEAREFRRNGVIGKRLYRSYEMFLDFIGVQVMNTSGDLNIQSLQRLELALVHNVHNHLRIRRMLACLSVVGFRRLALKFLFFLQRVIQQYFPGRLDIIFMSSWSKFSNKNISNALKNCGIENTSAFEEENPYVQDLVDTPYSFWKGYPNSQHSTTLIELLQADKPTTFLHTIPLLFPTKPRDIEDVRTIYGFEKYMQDVVAKAEQHLGSVEYPEAYLPQILESLKKFGMAKLATRLSRLRGE